MFSTVNQTIQLEQSNIAVSGIMPSFDLVREHNKPYTDSGYFVSDDWPSV